MSESVRRVRAQFSTIQITMISIVVALALQEWLDRLPTIDALWEPSWVGTRVWCQALIGFAIILKMWTGFVLGAATSHRVPRPLDLIGPMGLLVFVDAQIASIDVEHALRWLYVLGVGSLAAAGLIVGQRMTFDTNPETDPTTGRAFAALPDPATVEVWIGVGALVAGLAHQTIGLGERSLLAFCIVMLIVQIGSAAGPIMAWRILYRREAALLREEDAATPP
ncbi:MAG TPA: hypothetical protein VFG38_08605 [Pseudomonadales bacterium]|nr:hypothetical protein [Pseudomonadales bacterium]